MITELMGNYYWLGVLFAFVCILMSIRIHFIVKDSYNMETKEGFKDAGPASLLFLLFSFLSWYAIAILLAIVVIRIAVELIVWIIKSIFWDFGN